MSYSLYFAWRRGRALAYPVQVGPLFPHLPVRNQSNSKLPNAYGFIATLMELTADKLLLSCCFSPAVSSPVASAAAVTAAVQEWDPFVAAEPAAAAAAAPAPLPSSPKAAVAAMDSPSGKASPHGPEGGEASPAGWGAQMDAGHLFQSKETEDLDRR